LHGASRAQGTRKLIAESKNRSQGSRGIEGQSEKKIEANTSGDRILLRKNKDI
jgi:hypothetical protein